MSERAVPPARSGTGAGTWILLVLLLVVLALVAWMLFGGGSEEANVEVDVPAAEVEVPDEVNVEVGTDGENK